MEYEQCGETGLVNRTNFIVPLFLNRSFNKTSYFGSEFVNHFVKPLNKRSWNKHFIT